jgi:hypothetical protein
MQIWLKKINKIKNYFKRPFSLGGNDFPIGRQSFIVHKKSFNEQICE